MSAPPAPEPTRVRSFARAALLLATLCLAACDDARAPATSPDRTRATVTIGDARIDAELARTSAEKQLGLGGRTGLAPDTGMLFVFDEPDRHLFWMLDMQFALDFVWIRDDRVVDLTPDVPPPPPDVDAGSGLLRQVSPRAPAVLVLEVAAGTIAKHGWKIGDAVAIEPPLP